MVKKHLSRLNVIVGRILLLVGFVCMVSCHNPRHRSDSIPQDIEEVVQQPGVIKERVSELYITQKSWAGTEVEAFLASDCTLEDDTVVWFFQPIDLERLEKKMEAVHVQQGCKRDLDNCFLIECARIYKDIVEQFMEKHPTYSYYDLRSGDWWGHDRPYDRLAIWFVNDPQREKVPFPEIDVR
ncbi:MAG: hypothetical protein LBI53_04830 [Candidatus Peribacteria bacterium]|jgi:hypothetical protein|nr:hypothetical protein [Candidatus Peribacteria bacterium]